MKNLELFHRDPTKFTIPNDGVTTVTYPETPEQWRVLEYELRSFVCEGQYRQGLERILTTYLAHLDKNKQPAVWVSGFYGSGKSHLVRVLEHYWRNLQLPDGTEARTLSTLPSAITDLLQELTTAGKRHGGLWAAAGRLSGGADSIRLDILRVILESAGLPSEYAPARFVIWLKQQGLYETVRSRVEQEGVKFEEELRNLYVSPLLANSILAAYPDFADNQKEARSFLKAQYPQRSEITNGELVDTIRMVLELQSDKPGTLPCTLLVFDEVQQAIGEDIDRALEVQAIVEDLSSEFGASLLLVATGQSAIQATPQLQKLEGRFSVRIELSDQDVERVVREVVLRKNPATVPALREVLEDCSGEIDRHLAGSRIAPTAADRDVLIPDYPLLPTRRRFWERVLRAIDTGAAAQLRTQLRMVHEATRVVADKDIGTVVGGDFIYDQQKSPMLQSGVLLNDLAVIIDEQDDGTADGRLRSRLCSTIFLIGQLPQTGAAAIGLRADATTLADLLVEDLPVGSASIRQRIPQLLDSMTEEGVLMLVEGEYQLQTRESAEWQGEFRRRLGSIRGDTTRIAGDRATALRVAVDNAVKSVRLVQGVNKTPRKLDLHFGQEAPSTQSTSIPVWIRDAWTVTEKTVRDDARGAGTEDPTIFVLLPRLNSDALTNALAGYAAAEATLSARPAQQTTPEGVQARKGMETRRDIEARKIQEIIEAVIHEARVYQGGGNEVVGETLATAVQTAAGSAMVRLFPGFSDIDGPGWNLVVSRAGQGNADALEAVKHKGDVADHPAAKQVLNRISASGTKGSDIRNQFMGVGFGWPQDAVDGILLTLLNAGHISATDKSGQPVSAKQIPQSQIGVTTFRSETYVLSTIERIGLRTLAQQLGVTAKAGEEAGSIQAALQRLRDLANQVAGQPPLPAAPNVDHIAALQNLTGNEQLARVYQQRENLVENYKEWTALLNRKESRLARWNQLQQLMKQAESLPVAETIGPQIEAVREQRTLLDDPDPVKPLLEQSTSALRQALQDARQKVEEVQARELAAIEKTPEWLRPDSSKVWKPILAKHRLGPVDSPDVSTDEKLLEALNTKPLASWEMEIEAIPTRIEEARQEAAKAFMPKAVTVRPKSATLDTAADVEAYIADLKTEIMSHIDDGKPVII